MTQQESRRYHKEKEEDAGDEPLRPEATQVASARLGRCCKTAISLAGATRRIKQTGIRNAKVAILFVDRRNLPSTRANCGNICSLRGEPHVPGSRNTLDGSDGIYRIHSDQPRAANVQQPLNHRSIPRSFSGIFPCNHVHSPREAATKTCLHRAFHGTILPGLGHLPRRRRLRSVIGSA